MRADEVSPIRNIPIIMLMDLETRVKMTKRATRFALKRLVEKGCKLKTVDDGGEEDEWIDVTEKPIKEVLEDIMAVDMAQLLIENPEGKEKWIQFVFGNAPNEIICNYHCCSTIDEVADEVYTKFE